MSLMSQISEKSETTKTYTQDNRHVDERLYSNYVMGEKVREIKPEKNGKKGAVVEFIRDLLDNINKLSGDE